MIVITSSARQLAWGSGVAVRVSVAVGVPAVLVGVVRVPVLVG
jgi:hypothetical protein